MTKVLQLRRGLQTHPKTLPELSSELMNQCLGRIRNYTVAKKPKTPYKRRNRERRAQPKRSQKKDTDYKSAKGKRIARKADAAGQVVGAHAPGSWAAYSRKHLARFRQDRPEFTDAIRACSAAYHVVMSDPASEEANELISSGKDTNAKAKLAPRGQPAAKKTRTRKTTQNGEYQVPAEFTAGTTLGRDVHNRLLRDLRAGRRRDGSKRALETEKLMRRYSEESQRFTNETLEALRFLNDVFPEKTCCVASQFGGRSGVNLHIVDVKLPILEMAEHAMAALTPAQEQNLVRSWIQQHSFIRHKDQEPLPKRSKRSTMLCEIYDFCMCKGVGKQALALVQNITKRMKTLFPTKSRPRQLHELGYVVMRLFRQDNKRIESWFGVMSSHYGDWELWLLLLEVDSDELHQLRARPGIALKVVEPVLCDVAAVALSSESIGIDFNARYMCEICLVMERDVRHTPGCPGYVNVKAYIPEFQVWSGRPEALKVVGDKSKPVAPLPIADGHVEGDGGGGGGDGAEGG